MKKKIIRILLTLIIPALIIIFRPLEIAGYQAIVLSALVLTVTWWASGIVERTIASVFLIVIFLIFGHAPIKLIFQFPLSETCYILIFSFLFSEGIKNSGLADKLLAPLLYRYARTVPRILISIMLLCLVMIFIIPQAFSRVILLSFIYGAYFSKLNMPEKTREALLFAVYAFTIFIDMGFLRGDMLLSYGLLGIAGTTMTDVVWMKYMTVPTFIFCIIAAFLFFLTFRKSLALYKPDPVLKGISPPAAEPLNKKEKKDLAFILIVVTIWATEAIHGIGGVYIVAAGAFLMFPVGLLKLNDFKCVNVKLLIFIMTTFSIGSVMKTSGLADLIFLRFIPLLPKEFSVTYIFIITISTMVLHMFLGSNMTTMTVAIPAVLSIGSGVAPPEILMFTVYVALCSHFMLPFHQVLVLVGEGKGDFPSKTVTKFGLSLTVLAAIAVIAIYGNWWKLIGLL